MFMEGFSLPGVAFSTAALLPVGTLSSFWQETGSSKLRLVSGTFCGKQNCAEISHVLYENTCTFTLIGLCDGGSGSTSILGSF